MTGDGDEQAVRAQIPADVDAADKVLYGLTFRQLAILAAAALFGYGGWQALTGRVPTPVLLAVAVLCGAAVFVLAVGRRDGLPMDRWLLAAVRYARAPHALSTPTNTRNRLPDWVQPPPSTVWPAPLRLPADAITENGDIRLGGTRAAMVAATSVNLALRTAGEQAALIDTFGRWLNSLAAPTQIVVSAQPVDLHSAARAVTDHAVQLPHPALAEAAGDHAAFLTELAARRDPLRRQLLIVTQAGGGEHAARRRAGDTARALSALGVDTRVLDGPAATAALAAAADPYRPPRPGGLAASDTVITGPPPTVAAASRKPTP